MKQNSWLIGIALVAVGVGIYFFVSKDKPNGANTPSPNGDSDPATLAARKWLGEADSPAKLSEAMSQLESNPDLTKAVLVELELLAENDDPDKASRAYTMLVIFANVPHPKLAKASERARDILIGKAEDEQTTHRNEAIESLGKFDPQHWQKSPQKDAVLEMLVSQLDAEESQRRLVAALVLRRIASTGHGRPLDPKVLDAKTFAGEWQRIAFFGMPKPDDKSSVALLGEGVTNNDPAIRIWSVQALEMLAPSMDSVRTVVPQLAKVFRNPDDPAGNSAATVLGNLAARDAKAMLVGVRGLGSDVSTIRLRSALLLNVAHFLARVRPIRAEVRTALENPDIVKTLGKALTASEREVRQQAVATLELVGDKAAPAIPDLLTALDSSDDAVRVAAARALGAVASQPDTVIPKLMKYLGSENPGLSRSVALSLARFDKAAVAPLLEVLRGDEVRGRTASASALGLIGVNAVDAVADLEKALQAKEPSVRVASALALWQVTGSTDKTLPILAKELKSEESPIRVLASEAFSTMGVAARASVSTLADALGDDELTVRRHCVEALGKMGPFAVSAVPALSKLLEENPKTKRRENLFVDSPEFVSQRAVDAIRAVGPSATGAKSALAKVLEANPDIVAADASTLIDPDDASPLPILLEALRQPDQNEQDRAARAIGRLGPKAGDAVKPLLAALERDPRAGSPIKDALVKIGSKAVPDLIEASKGTSQQIGVFDVLGRMGSAAKSALPRLESAAKNPQTSELAVRDLGLMAERGEPGAVTLLVELIDNELIRISALRALGSSGKLGEPAVDPLLKRLESAKGREQEEILATLGQFGDVAKSARQPLEKLLTSSDERLRVGAALALARIGGSADKVEASVTRLMNKSKEDEVRAVAVLALEAVGSERGEVPKGLEKALEDKSLFVRLEAIRSIDSLGKKMKEPKRLLPELKESDVRIRSSACLALEDAGVSAEDAVPILIERLGDAERQARIAATVALGRYGKKAESALDSIRKAFPGLSSRAIPVSPTVRLAVWRITGDTASAVSEFRALLEPTTPYRDVIQAVFALGEMGPDASAAVPRLCLWLDSPRVELRLESAIALGKMGKQPAEVVAFLERATLDADPEVSKEAKKALEKVR